MDREVADIEDMPDKSKRLIFLVDPSEVSNQEVYRMLTASIDPEDAQG